jgi:hypothetical protein
MPVLLLSCRCYCAMLQRRPHLAVCVIVITADLLAVSCGSSARVGGLLHGLFANVRHCECLVLACCCSLFGQQCVPVSSDSTLRVSAHWAIMPGWRPKSKPGPNTLMLLACVCNVAVKQQCYWLFSCWLGTSSDAASAVLFVRTKATLPGLKTLVFFVGYKGRRNPTSWPYTPTRRI